jgi:hypothetical protein
MNNKQVFLKPNVVFETLANNWYVRSDSNFFKSVPHTDNFYNEKCKSISQITNSNELLYFLSITDRQISNILILNVPFDQPHSDGPAKNVLLHWSFSGLQPDDNDSIRWVGKRYCFTKRPLINHPN